MVALSILLLNLLFPKVAVPNIELMYSGYDFLIFISPLDFVRNNRLPMRRLWFRCP